MLELMLFKEARITEDRWSGRGVSLKIVHRELTSDGEEVRTVY
jgi:hypothetical protein